MADILGGSGTDIVRVLELCRDIELECSELYRCLAESFRDDAPVARLFRKTAMEEDNHANQFVLAIKMHRLGAIETVSVESERAAGILAAIRSLLAGFREKRPELVDALRAALTLEEKLETFHVDAIASFANDYHRKLFEAFMKADQDHIEELRVLQRQRFGPS